MKRPHCYLCTRPMKRGKGDGVFICVGCATRTDLVPHCRECGCRLSREGLEPDEIAGWCDDTLCQGARLEYLASLDQRELDLASVELGIDQVLGDPTARGRYRLLRLRGVEIVRASGAYL